MIKILGLTLAAAGMMTLSTQAVPIVGSIGFTGEYTQNGGTLGNLASATSMTIDTHIITTTSGDFVGAGAPSTFATPIWVNAGVGANVGLQLWSVTVAGVSYTLDITTSIQSFTSADQLNIKGSGTMERNGLDATGGTWQLGFGVSGASFTWQGTSAANVPDGGSTLILLGSAIVGLFGIARKSLQA